MNKKKIHNIICNFLYIVLSAIALLWLLPYLITVTSSFAADGDKLIWIPEMVSLSQYRALLFEGSSYLNRFWNSVFLTVIIVVGQTSVSILTAYGLYRKPTAKKKLYMYGCIIMMLLPLQVTLLPNYLMIRQMRLLDTWWALVLPAIFSPFSVYLMKKYMDAIPAEIVEAAMIDGANSLQILTRICLPICRNGILLVVLLLFFDYWNMVEQPIVMLTDSEQYPLSIFLANLSEADNGILYAAAVIYSIPPILLFFYGKDAIKEGISFDGSLN